MKMLIRFATNRPLTQAEGMAMWSLGGHFKAVGASVYQLDSEGWSPDGAPLPEAIDAACTQIAAYLPDVDQVVITGVSADLVGDEMPERRTMFAATGGLARQGLASPSTWDTVAPLLAAAGARGRAVDEVTGS